MTLILLAMGWLTGIAAVALWDAPWWVGALLVACTLPTALLSRKRGIAMLAIAMVLCALASGGRFAAWEHRPVPPATRYIGQFVTFEGTVVSEPVPSEKTASSVVSMQRVRTKSGWVSTAGRVRVSFGQYASYLPGDKLCVSGTIEQAPVFDDFDYRAYLARQDIIGTIYRPNVEVLATAANTDLEALITRMRLRLDGALQHALPEPAASLAGGIAFGRDSGLPDSLADDFRTTGLAHIVAVSGANVSMIAALAFVLLLPLLGRRWAIVPAALLVGSYVLLAGASASVVRAGIMAAVLLAGEWIGRPQSGLPALAAAIIAMTAIQPAAASDVGFQLSAAATAGLIAFSPWIRAGLNRWLRRGPGLVFPELVFETAALTLAATASTLPILWVNFGRISLVSPIANVLVAPILVVALPLAMLTALAGAVSSPLGWLFGLITYYPVTFIIAVAGSLAQIPGAAIAVPAINGSVALAFVAGLSALGALAYRYLPAASPRGRNLLRKHLLVRGLSSAGAGIAALAIVIGGSLLPLAGPGVLKMVALDVGQGDAILLETPHGHTMLIDGGVSDMLLARQLGAVLPHWDRSIDIVFMTHPDDDHLGGLPGVLRRFDVQNLWDTGVDGTSADAVAYRNEPGRTTIHRGDHFELDGVRVDVLWPPADNEGAPRNATSLVMRVTYGETHFLLTGDLEAEEQRKLIALGGIGADVLKVPHHGSKTSDPAFFDAVGADVAVISVGANNPYGHPAAETLAALHEETILRTDLNGRITVRSDGQNLSWDTQR